MQVIFRNIKGNILPEGPARSDLDGRLASHVWDKEVHGQVLAVHKFINLQWNKSKLKILIDTLKLLRIV